jgi:hypothetical protein
MRQLREGQEVVIIYDSSIGFTQQSGTFLRYQWVGDKRVPIFKTGGKQLTGHQCFWLLPSNIKNEKEVLEYQYELAEMQLKASEIAQKMGYPMVNKVQDKQIQEEAKRRSAIRDSFVKKFGFDPRDTAWVEEVMATNDLERDWFAFERENPDVPYVVGWTESLTRFNATHRHPITLQLAQQLSKKRVRYLLGAFNTRMTLNKNAEDWKASALEFEDRHRKREERMVAWSEKRQNKFPKAITKRPIKFLHGPYFRQCIENVPDIFTSPRCDFIKPGIELELISFDSENGYMRLDFPATVRKRIRPDPSVRWSKEEADYEIWVRPDEKDCLEFQEEVR